MKTQAHMRKHQIHIWIARLAFRKHNAVTHLTARLPLAHFSHATQSHVTHTSYPCTKSHNSPTHLSSQLTHGSVIPCTHATQSRMFSHVYTRTHARTQTLRAAVQSGYPQGRRRLRRHALRPELPNLKRQSPKFLGPKRGLQGAFSWRALHTRRQIVHISPKHFHTNRPAHRIHVLSRARLQSKTVL